MVKSDHTCPKKARAKGKGREGSCYNLRSTPKDHGRGDWSDYLTANAHRNSLTMPRQWLKNFQVVAERGVNRFNQLIATNDILIPHHR